MNFAEYKLRALKLWDFLFFYRKFNVGKRYFRYRRRNMTGNYKSKVRSIRRERNQAAGRENAVSLCSKFLPWYSLFAFVCHQHLSCYRRLTIFSFNNTVRFAIVNSYLFECC